MQTKKCSTCELDKPFDAYSPDKRNKSGRQSRCKKCSATASLQYHSENREACNAARNARYKKDPTKTTNSNLKRLYGITLEQKKNMILAQNNKCAVCSVHFMDKKGAASACVDHNHQTGVVREILCNRCNSAIGYVGENIDILESIIAYIRKHDKKEAA